MRRRVAAVALGSIAAVVATAALLPPGLSAITLAVAFLAGTALERYRQGQRQRPLRLTDTPGLWVAAARDSVGLPAAAVAAGAAAAALALLLLPSLSTTGAPDRGVGGTPEAPPIDRAALPRLEVLRRSPGSAFTVAGARFLVYSAGSPPASALQAQPEHGGHWISVGVDSENLRRARFDPNRLSYRLRDKRGNAYYPDSSAGSGPASLAVTGFLRRGETANARLLFRIPRSARRLVLVFEPEPSGRIQVRVPLG